MYIKYYTSAIIATPQGVTISVCQSSWVLNDGKKLSEQKLSNSQILHLTVINIF